MSTLLSIETTSFHGSIALFDDCELLSCESLDTSCRSAQSLAPGIQTLLKQHGKSMSNIDGIAVAQGPGSFTGLRVGITTAKVLAYSLGIDVVGVNTLDAMALGVVRGSAERLDRIDCVMDAQRREVFLGQYEYCEIGGLSRNDQIKTVAIEAWLAGINKEVFVAGDLLRKLNNQDPSMLEAVCWSDTGAAVVEDCNIPSAQWVGMLALQPELVQIAKEDAHEVSAELSSAFALLPRYYRRSAAEEKLG